MAPHLRTRTRSVIQRHTLFRVFLAACTTAVIVSTDARANGSASARKTGPSLPCNVVVYHAPTAPPTYIDNGLPGDSPGDQRIFHFDGETADGSAVVMDWIMTTTGLDTAEGGAESRVTLGVFSFTGADTDQIMLEGVGLYPGSEDTFVPDAELRRAIIGGTGRFRGASGEVLSTHLADGSWTHEFRFSNCKRRSQGAN